MSNKTLKTMKIRIIILLILSATTGLLAQVPEPAAPQEEAILLKGGIAHLGNGQVIQNSFIAFDQGKITLVADATSTRIDFAGYKIIDITGKHVYPGFILPNSQVGLQEVSSIRAMDDYRERGDFNPNVRALVAYNTDSELPPTFRVNGILLAETTPTGGRFSGSSSLMHMDGWNWEDAVHTADVAIHMNWPARKTGQFDFATFTFNRKPNKDYDKQVREVAAFFDDALAYGAATAKERNLKLEAMQGLFDGTKVLMVHTSGPKDIVDAVAMAKEKGVQRVAIVTGTDALLVKDFLAANKVPVVLTRLHSLPGREDMDVDLPYRMAVELTQAGVTVALSHTGMLALARNLPFYAGTSAAYGLDKEEALKLITLNPATILGVADKLGTLAEGKDATLFVSEGDALDFRTNRVLQAYIQGRQLHLKNRQQVLYERYIKKYGLQK